MADHEEASGADTVVSARALSGRGGIEHLPTPAPPAAALEDTAQTVNAALPGGFVRALISTRRLGQPADEPGRVEQFVVSPSAGVVALLPVLLRAAERAGNLGTVSLIVPTTMLDDVPALERALLPDQLLLQADPRVVAVDPVDPGITWTAVAFQRRDGGAALHVGHLRQVSLAELEHDAALRAALVTCYREVFGGAQWREWMCCTAQGCEAQYSRDEYQQLQPSGVCRSCGQSGTLVPYYTDDMVLRLLRRDLEDETHSRCYLRLGAAGGTMPQSAVEAVVDAFVWGHTARVARVLEEAIADELRADQCEGIQRHLRALMLRAIVTSRDPHARAILDLTRAVADMGQLVAYYQAELGIAERARGGGVSLARAIFQRVCQFARDAHAWVVMTRTTPRSNAYALLRSLDMEPLYIHADGRVVLAGATHELLERLTEQTDRQLGAGVLRALRALRAEQVEGTLREPGSWASQTEEV